MTHPVDHIDRQSAVARRPVGLIGRFGIHQEDVSQTHGRPVVITVATSDTGVIDDELACDRSFGIGVGIDGGVRGRVARHIACQRLVAIQTHLVEGQVEVAVHALAFPGEGRLHPVVAVLVRLGIQG